MQQIAVVKISMQHTKKTWAWPKQHKVLGSIPVMETYNVIFHSTPNEIKLCVNVFVLLVQELLLAQFDEDLAVLFNCYWMVLMDAEIFQKLFKIQCFLHCCWHTLTLCFWWPKNTVACFLTPLLSGALSMKKYPVVIVLLLIFCRWNHKTSLHPLISFVLLSFKSLESWRYPRSRFPHSMSWLVVAFSCLDRWSTVNLQSDLVCLAQYRTDSSKLP